MFIFRLLALDLEPDTTLTVITDSFSPVVIKRFYLEYFLFSWEEIQLGYKYLACFEIIWNLSSSARLPLSPPLYPSLCSPWSVTQASVVLLQFWSVGAREKYFGNISNLKIFHIQRHVYSFPPGGASRYPTFFRF